MTARMLLHMPWYHYVAMGVLVVAVAVLTHLRIRRRYWPRHAMPSGLKRVRVEHVLILAGVEVVAAVVVLAAVSGGMLAYHLR